MFSLFCFAYLNNSMFYILLDECEDDEEEVSIADNDYEDCEEICVHKICFCSIQYTHTVGRVALADSKCLVFFVSATKFCTPLHQ